MSPKLAFLAIVLFGLRSSGQMLTPPGQTPPNIKWQQIRTPHFKIVFPKEIEADAQRIANAMENSYHDGAASLKYLPAKMPIVMQNQTSDNNAFVTPEGRRAEFFSTPPQNPNNMGLNNWYDELSLHEYRHVVQTDQTKTGWGKALYYLFGNSGTAITQGLTNPWWFWEGDAVGCESALGYGGRGRIPSFDLTFRTQLLTRGAFPYVKSACGSLKNAIPNHYLLGYLMTTYAKNHYGADVWSKVLKRTYTTAPIPFSFSRSMKKITGYSSEEMYAAMTAEVKNMWNQQIEDLKETKADYFNQPSSKVFVNYKFPQYLPDGSIVVQKAGLETGSFLAYKSSIVDQSQFVLLTKDGKEKKIRISGVLDDNGVLSSAGDKIVWSEFSYDPRWGAKNYTVIKVLDVKTKRIKQITHRSRVHAPCFSPDGRTIAAIETNTSNKVYVILFDTETGDVIKRFDNPGNNLFVQPHFTKDGKSIIMVLAQAGTKSIVRLDVETGMMKMVLRPVPENLSAPVDYRNYILYNSTLSGIDNIYAIDTLTNIVYQVTNRKYGAFNPCISPDETTISFQDFTPDGFRIATMPILPEAWTIVNHQEEAAGKIEYFQPFAQEEAGNILAHIPDSVYPVNRFHRLRNAVKIYSWGIDPLTNLPQMGIGIRSEDLLSTTELQAGYRFDNNQDHWGRYFRINYNGLFPQFFLDYADGKRNTVVAKGEEDTLRLTYDLIDYHDVNVGVVVPLNLSGGPYIRKLTLSVQGTYTELMELNHRSGQKGYSRQELGDLYSLQYDAAFEMQMRQSLRDVAPRFGTSLHYTFRDTPLKSFFQAKQSAVDMSLYVPGFFPHHSIKLRACIQEDASSSYHFDNRFDFIRNNRDQLFHELKIGSVDYKFPLGYPDLSVLKGVLYVQRLKLGLFSEWGFGRTLFENTGNSNYTNLGIELTGDVNVMRFLLPCEMGIRSSYLAQTHSVYHSFICKLPLF